MTTYQKAALLKSLQKLDHEMRLCRYPAVLEADPVMERLDEIEADAHGLSVEDYEAVLAECGARRW